MAFKMPSTLRSFLGQANGRFSPILCDPVADMITLQRPSDENMTGVLKSLLLVYTLRMTIETVAT